MFLHKMLSYCQLSHNEKPAARQLTNQDKFKNYRPLPRLSMDLKVMPKSQKGDKYILCIIDKMTNYLITVPIY